MNAENELTPEIATGGYIALPGLVDRMAKQWLTLTEHDARRALLQSLEVIRTTLIEGHTVYLPGLGTLGTYKSLPRKGRNPRKPEVTIDIPAKTRVYFTAEKPLLKELNSL